MQYRLHNINLFQVRNPLKLMGPTHTIETSPFVKKEFSRPILIHPWTRHVNMSVHPGRLPDIGNQCPWKSIILIFVLMFGRPRG